MALSFYCDATSCCRNRYQATEFLNDYSSMKMDGIQNSNPDCAFLMSPCIGRIEADALLRQKTEQAPDVFFIEFHPLSPFDAWRQINWTKAHAHQAANG